MSFRFLLESSCAECIVMLDCDVVPLEATKVFSFLYWLQYNSNFWYPYILDNMDFLTYDWFLSKQFFCLAIEFLDFILRKSCINCYIICKSTKVILNKFLSNQLDSHLSVNFSITIRSSISSIFYYLFIIGLWLVYRMNMIGGTRPFWAGARKLLFFQTWINNIEIARSFL